METIVLSSIDIEAPVIASGDRAEPAAEVVTIDDVNLRLVGGGHVITLQY